MQNLKINIKDNFTFSLPFSTYCSILENTFLIVHTICESKNRTIAQFYVLFAVLDLL